MDEFLGEEFRFLSEDFGFLSEDFKFLTEDFEFLSELFVLQTVSSLSGMKSSRMTQSGPNKDHVSCFPAQVGHGRPDRKVKLPFSFIQTYEPDRSERPVRFPVGESWRNPNRTDRRDTGSIQDRYRFDRLSIDLRYRIHIEASVKTSGFTRDSHFAPSASFGECCAKVTVTSNPAVKKPFEKLKIELEE